MHIKFVKHYNGNFGYKFDILPEQFEKIKQEFYNKVKEKSKEYNGFYNKTYIVIEINPKEKAYYTIYGDRFLLEKILYQISKGE